jgi:hypothetical protein
MLLAKINGREITQYPYFLSQLREDHPTVSFPDAPSQKTLARRNAAPVQLSERPSFDPLTQSCHELPPEWVGDDLVQRWQVSDLTPDAVAGLLEARKAEMREAVRAQRWRVETSGVSVGGVIVQSGETSQAKIQGANLLFELDPSLDAIDWEAQPGVWTSMDRDTVRMMGVLTGRHVQACFSQARALHEAIAAAPDHAALDAINIYQGWPEGT